MNKHLKSLLLSSILSANIMSQTSQAATFAHNTNAQTTDATGFTNSNGNAVSAQASNFFENDTIVRLSPSAGSLTIEKGVNRLNYNAVGHGSVPLIVDSRDTGTGFDQLTLRLRNRTNNTNNNNVVSNNGATLGTAEQSDEFIITLPNETGRIDLVIQDALTVNGVSNVFATANGGNLRFRPTRDTTTNSYFTIGVNRVQISGSRTLTVEPDATQLSGSQEYLMQANQIMLNGNLGSTILLRPVNSLGQDVSYKATIAGTFNMGGDGYGTIDASEVVNNNYITELVLSGNVGTSAEHLGEVKIADGGKVSLVNGNGFIDNVNLLGNNNGSTLELQSDKNYLVKINNPNAKGKVNIVADNAKILAGSVLGSQATPLEELVFSGDKNLTLDPNVDIHASKVSSAVGEGTITISGANTLDAKFTNFKTLIMQNGSDVSLLKESVFSEDINIQGSSSLNFKANSQAPNYHIDSSQGKINIVNGANNDILIKGNVVTPNGGGGELNASGLSANNKLTIEGDIGSNNNKLSVARVADDTSMNIAGNSYINLVEPQGNNPVLELSGKDKNYFIGSFSGLDGKGTVSSTSDNITILPGSNLGAANNKLENIVLSLGNSFNISNGVPIYLANGKLQGSGIVNYLGSSTVSAKIEGCDSFNLLGASSQVDFLEEVSVTGNSVINTGNRARFTKDVTAANLDSNVANSTAILEFANTSPIAVNANIGNNQPLNIELSSNNIDFSSAINANNKIAFTNAALASSMAIDGASLGPLLPNLSTAGSGIHNINFRGNLDVNSPVGTSANNFNKLLFADDGVMNVNSDIHARIESLVNNEGTVNINVPDATIYGIGTSVAAPKLVNFNENANVSAGSFANQYSLNSGHDVNFSDGNVTGPISLDGVGSRVSFTNVPVLDSLITTTNAFKNEVEINGNIIIEKDIGTKSLPLARVDLNSKDGQVQNLKSSIYAQNVAVNNITLIVSGDVIIDAAIVAGYSRLSLKEGTKLVNMQNSTLTFVNIEPTISDDPDLTSKISVDSCDLFLSNVTITPQDNAQLPGIDGDSRTIFDIENGGCVHSDSNVNIDNTNNPFVDYSLVDDNTTLVRKNIASKVLSEAALKAVGAGDDILVELTELDKLSNPANPKKGVINEKQDFYRNFSKDEADRLAAKYASNLLNEAAPLDSQRPVVQTINSVISSPAAGDEMRNLIEFNAWFRPFYFQGKSKSHGKYPGSLSLGYGGAIGFDQEIYDNFILGLAFSYSKTDVKQKDFKAGDTSRVDSFSYSIYGRYDINKNIFLTTIGSFTDNIVKAKEQHNPALQTIAQSSYSFGSTYAELMAGYQYKLHDNLTIIPIIGSSYYYGGDYSFKQTGPSNSIKSVKRSAANRVEGMWGTRFASNVTMKEVPVTLGGYFLYRHRFVADNADNVDVQIDGLATPLAANKNKFNKDSFNLGIELGAEYGDAAYSILYDVSMEKKYRLHQGSAKLSAKIEF